VGIGGYRADRKRVMGASQSSHATWAEDVPESAPSGGAPEVEESNVLLECVPDGEALRAAVRLEGGPLLPYDQGDIEMCTSCSYSFCCTVLALRNLDAPERFKRVSDASSRVCPLYPYLLQIQKECESPDERCKCASESCSSACDLACGSVAKYLLPVFERGVPSLQSTHDAGLSWSMRQGTPPGTPLPPVLRLADHRTFHSRFDGVVLSEISNSLSKGYLCVANLRVHPNQTSALRSAHVGASPGGKSDKLPSDPSFSLPDPSASMAREIGHAVSIYGIDTHRQCLLVRNSYGPEWGCCGDFNIPLPVAMKAKTFHFIVIMKSAHFV
jgi:hypothetical protein